MNEVICEFHNDGMRSEASRGGAVPIGAPAEICLMQVALNESSLPYRSLFAAASMRPPYRLVQRKDFN